VAAVGPRGLSGGYGFSAPGAGWWWVVTDEQSAAGADLVEPAHRVADDLAENWSCVCGFAGPLDGRARRFRRNRFRLGVCSARADFGRLTVRVVCRVHVAPLLTFPDVVLLLGLSVLSGSRGGGQEGSERDQRRDLGAFQADVNQVEARGGGG
jgi:hypothetical protein